MKIYSIIFIISHMLFLISCDNSENSPPWGPTNLIINLKIVDENGNSLLKDKIDSKEDLVTSQFKFISSCNGKNLEIKRLFFYPKNENILVLITDLHNFNYMTMEGFTGNMTYKLQLPTVFEDNREISIEIKWRVKEKTEYSQVADIEEVYLNGEKVDDIPVITMVVDE